MTPILVLEDLHKMFVSMSDDAQPSASSAHGLNVLHKNTQLIFNG